MGAETRTAQRGESASALIDRLEELREILKYHECASEFTWQGDLREAVLAVQAWEILQRRQWNVGQYYKNHDGWGMRTSGGYDLPLPLLLALPRPPIWSDPVTAVLETEAVQVKLEQAEMSAGDDCE